MKHQYVSQVDRTPFQGRFLKTSEVCALTGWTPKQLYEAGRSGRFPPPLHKSRWSEKAVLHALNNPQDENPFWQNMPAYDGKRGPQKPSHLRLEGKQKRLGYLKKYYKKRRKVKRFILKQRIGAAIRRAIKLKEPASSRCKYLTMLGYNAVELRSHLERQFTEGMSLENYGKWHVDHIRPIASYKWDVRNVALIREIWALQNLQPLWRDDNIRKGAKWEHSMVNRSAAGLPTPSEKNERGTKNEVNFV